VKSGENRGKIVVGFDRERKQPGAGNVTSNLVYSPDGKWLVTGNGGVGDDSPGEVVVWDVAGTKKHVGLKGHPAAVRQVAFTPDGRRLVSASADGTILVWDFADAVKK
jgi:WD40 repeat protein